ncbi:mitochondrial import receptor subunit TOM22 homolog isoform X1 [Drosophila guanche]|uniref:mitochondrial import receptor subunit TOM22 homolog isoform X1 n=1 Tax=Drosophila guanche TaxID=7266 RepID=UPI001470CEE4|nr:mitochondrial import receptor subunit TOM22 homolog isoform X1 [Drosophila guanche]
MDSDPEIEFIEKDSGMSSLGGSKDETPERRTVATVSKNVQPARDGEENFDDEPDETIGERILGLTEMFPDSVRNAVATVAGTSVNGCKGLFSFSRNAAWIFFTTSIIMFAPIVFETERANMEELHRSQQTQVLLGPSSAMASTGPAPNLPLIR